MFKNGDVVIVYSPKEGGREVGTHPFVVIDNEGDMEGRYDFSAILMSSLTTDHKIQKANKYLSNFIIQPEEQEIKKTKHIKSEVLPSFVYMDKIYLISSEELRVKKVGTLNDDCYYRLLDRYDELQRRNYTFSYVEDNMKKQRLRTDAEMER